MWFDFAICLLFGWLGVHKFRERKILMGILYFFTFGLFCIGWTYDSIKYLIRAIKGPVVDNDLVLLKEGTLPIIHGSTVFLQKNELCHYSNPATLYIAKTRVTGYSSGSSGVNIRIAKGVTYRTGGSKGAPIREKVMESFPGTLSITNQRIIFSSMQNSFDKNISTISSINPYDDGFILQFSSTSYTIGTKDVNKIVQILTILMNQSTD